MIQERNMRHVNMIQYAFLYKVTHSVLLTQSAQKKKKALFKLQPECFDGQLIGYGYTYKDTADRLQENDITSDQCNISLQESNELKIQ